MGKVISGWEYFASDEARSADIVNIFRCEFVAIEDVDQVPGKVIASFRASRTIQRVSNVDIEHYTRWLWNKLSKSNYFELNCNDRRNSFFDYLNDEDIEDIIFVKLQLDGWIVIPGSRKKDTMKYEFYLIHRDTGERAIVQVKSGNTKLTPLNWIKWKERVFLFQSNGLYEGITSDKVTCLNPETVSKFVVENIELLPAHLGYWVEYSNSRFT